MKRRDFIRLVGGAVASPAVWPAAALAQRAPRFSTVGILNLAPTDSENGLKLGLRELGYVEGRNIAYEARYADGQQERLDRLAAELLALKPALIASSTTQAIQAIRRVNTAVPIVMTAISDPIGSGLISTLARPGGSTTGVTLQSSDVAGKRLELLKEIAPQVSRVAVLCYKHHPPTALMFKETQLAAQALDIQLRLLEADTAGIEAAFDDIRRTGMQALIAQHTVAFVPHIPRIAALAAECRLPSIHEIRQYPAAGGLMSYGANIASLGHRAANFADRILK